MIAEVIARLKTAPGLVDVLPAEDVESIMKGTAPRSGTAFVLPYRERAEPNALAMGGFRQRVDVQLLVAFVVRRADDAKGGKRISEFDSYRDAIEQSLAGWAVEPSNDLFELVGAQAAPIGNGVTIYVQTWQTSRTLEKLT